ncbi:hypothetical protein V1279_000946 [Bradyrhizobium sp. AZCC 1610]|uniref:hypothetical protein n=1 Tax=Bradyrhizobium sp. AZCC 1610 TaxID=3117020 RepID=UPI002FF169E4
MRGHAADRDGVAIRRGGRRLLRADGACGAGAVFDVNGLPKTVAHPVGKQPAEHVAAATGPERQQHLDLLGGVVGRVLGAGRAWHGRERKQRKHYRA